MSKLVKTILVIAIVVAVIVYAAPFIGSIATLYGASAAVTAAITSAIIGTALSVGMSALTSFFRKAPTIPQASTERLAQSVAPAAPRKIVFGLTAAGNDVRFTETYGAKEDKAFTVFALASHRVNAIKQWVIEDQVTWENGSIIAHTDGVIGFRAVTEGTSSNGQAGGGGTLWTSASTFTGCAYLAVDYSLSQKAWPQGIPQKTVTIVEGCPVYDPRLDSTNGGSGPHRLGDQATWAYRNGSTEIGRNPALCLLTYLIGWRIAGKLVWGMGIPAMAINFENFRTYANICEEQVTLQGGGSVQRYTCDYITSTAEAHESTIGGISAAMGSCKLTDTAGLYQLVGGYDDLMGPKQTFNEFDLIGGVNGPAPYVWNPAQGGLSSTFNNVTGRFADPAQFYQVVIWGDVQTDDLPDGIPRSMALDLPAVSRAETCQRIAKQFLLRETRKGMFSATFGPRAFSVQVGSAISLSLPSQGWNGKIFRVQEQREVHDLAIQMTLREEDAAIYAWDREEKPLPSTIRPAGFDPNLTQNIEGVTITTRTYQGVS